MSRVLAPFTQFFDNAGNPLENGWLEFFVSGTNNSHKDTYADSAQAIKNSNPVQLDAAGRCPNIFGLGLYRVVLYENNPVTHVPGAQIQVFDPVKAEDLIPGAEGYFAEWDSTISYATGYIVYYNGDFFESVTDSNLGNPPSTTPTAWQQIEFLRIYNQHVPYDAGDVAVYNFQMYYSLVDNNIGNTPDTSPAYWEAAASGTVLLNWEESGTTFQPQYTGYDLGSPTNLIGDIYVGDGGVLYVGDGQDGALYHTGSNMFVLSRMGELNLGTTTPTALSFRTDSTIRWNITSVGHLLPELASAYNIGSPLLTIGSLYQGDGDIHYLGDSQDASIGHDGVSLDILNSTGVINFGTLSAAAINFIIDSSTKWSVDSLGMFIPGSNSVYDIGSSIANIKDIYQGDNCIHYFGDAQDVTMVFDGTNFLVATAGAIILNNWGVLSAGHLVPAISTTYDIGSPDFEVRDIYIGDSGALYMGEGQDAFLTFDGTNCTLQASAGQLRLITGTAQSIAFYINSTLTWSIDSASGALLPGSASVNDVGSIAAPLSRVFASAVPTIGNHLANKTYVDPVYVPTDYTLDASQTKPIDQHLSGIDTAIAAAGTPGSRAITYHIATAGQTVFAHSGTVENEQVFINGILLREGASYDYTKSGITVTLTAGATLNDVVTIITIANFAITNALDKTGDTMTGSLILDDDPVADLEAATKQYVDASDNDNLLINGNFDIWQRATSVTGPISTSYSCVDRFNVFDGADGTADASRQAFVAGQTDVPGDPKYYINFDLTVAATSGSPGILQRIERVDVVGSGTITVSFWVKATSGTPNIYVFARQVFGTGGTPSAQVDFHSAEFAISTTWTKYTKTLTIPSLTGKTIGTDGNDYLSIGVGIPLNVTTEIQLAQIKVERGSIATPFVKRTYAEELRLCERYYIAPVSSQLNRLSVGKTLTGVTYYEGVTFRTEMRGDPTIAITSTSEAGAGFNGVDETDITVASESKAGFRWNVDATTDSTGGSSVGVAYSADAEL